MISVQQARTQILAALQPTNPETIPLSTAHNRVLAHPIHARLTQPPADVSAMDGYALRAADAAEGARLRIVGAAPAGRPFDGTLKWGEAVRIFTGSLVPAGADTILLQENATADAETITVNQPTKPGQHIRRQGQDFATNDLLLPPGQRLGPRHIGLAAAANHPWLTVHRQPRIAILATGDELSLPGDPIPPGGIVSSNAHMLAALIHQAGAIPTILPTAPDTTEAIATAAAAAQGHDLLVTTGGASVGDHDLVQAGLSTQGFQLAFWKIAMRPGKPMIFGNLNGLAVIGLPGNPVSAYVCAILFLLPAIARLSGLTATTSQEETATLGAPLRPNDHRADHLRATLTQTPAGDLVATPFDRQDSALLHVLARAGALILRAPHAPALEAGAAVKIIRLDRL